MKSLSLMGETLSMLKCVFTQSFHSMLYSYLAWYLNNRLAEWVNNLKINIETDKERLSAGPIQLTWWLSIWRKTNLSPILSSTTLPNSYVILGRILSFPEPQLPFDKTDKNSNSLLKREKNKLKHTRHFYSIIPNTMISMNGYKITV